MPVSSWYVITFLEGYMSHYGAGHFDQQVSQNSQLKPVCVCLVSCLLTDITQRTHPPPLCCWCLCPSFILFSIWTHPTASLIKPNCKVNRNDWPIRTHSFLWLVIKNVNFGSSSHLSTTSANTAQTFQSISLFSDFTDCRIVFCVHAYKENWGKKKKVQI